MSSSCFFHFASLFVIIFHLLSIQVTNLAARVHPDILKAAANAALEAHEKLMISEYNSPLDETAKENINKVTGAVAQVVVAANDAKKVENVNICKQLAFILQLQMKKMEIKLAQLDVLEGTLMKECAEVERERLNLFHERLEMKRKNILVKEAINDSESL
jgi:hypothetical protein